MSSFKIASNLHASDDVLNHLEDVCHRLNLDDEDLSELVIAAICDTTISRANGVRCPSVFRHERLLGELKAIDEDDNETVPTEYLAIIRGMNLFFSIE